MEGVSKQMVQRLPIGLVQVKTGNTSQPDFGWVGGNYPARPPRPQEKNVRNGKNRQIFKYYKSDLKKR